jgi:hypothetical protein
MNSSGHKTKCEHERGTISGVLALLLLFGTAAAGSTSSGTNAADDLILAGRIDLNILEEPVYFQGCVRNMTLLKEGYMISVDSIYYRTVMPGTVKRIANFSLYKDGEVVKRSEVVDGDAFYYNKTIDGKEYTIIEFKVNGIYHGDGECTGTIVIIRPFFQYSDENRTDEMEIPVGGPGVPPSEEWNRTIREAGSGGIYSAQQTSDGGYILAGEKWLIKTGGNRQWSRIFIDSIISSVRQTREGGYILAGETSYSPWLIKTDSDGNEQWSRTFVGNGNERANSVQQTIDGGFILAGTRFIKTDANGNEQWNRTFGGKVGENATSEAYSVNQTSDGEYVFAGSIYIEHWKALIIKTDANGNEQWSKTFGGKGNDYAYSVQQTLDGGYIFAGTNLESGNSGWLIKVGGELADSTEKAPGFEMVLAITILLAIYTARRKRK